MKCYRMHLLIFFIFISFFCFQPLLYGQRPGIECGCEEYDDYISPESKGILVEQGETVQEGSSEEGKYTVQVVEAIPPNTVVINILYKGKSIYNEPSSAIGWGFSPDEDHFVMHGYDANGKHWCTLFNLDPDPGIEGEDAEYCQVIPATQVSSAHIRFSPHGHYLLYAAIGNNGNLLLNVFNTKTLLRVYNGSTNSPIVGSPAGESVGGWGFSPDPKDATFVHAYLTEINRYNLFVKNLASPENEFILEAINEQGGSFWRFSPCGDIFLWVYEDDLDNPVCRFYKTSQSNSAPYKTAMGINMVKIFTEDDGHYIEYINHTEKIFDNTADNTCPDYEEPTWREATLDTLVVTGSSITLQWSGAFDDIGVTRYRIYRDGSVIRELEAINHLEVTGLAPDSTYEFKVEAGDESGNWSSDGPSEDFTTKADNPPEWPVNSQLTADTIEGTRLTLHWPEAIDDWGIEFYMIFQNGSLADSIAGDMIEYTVKGLTPTETYTFAIEARDASDQCTENRLQLTKTLPPDDPPYWLQEDQLTATEITETSMLLEWPKAKDEYERITKYNIIQDSVRIASRKYNIPYCVEGLEEGTLYNFKIVACDEWNDENDPPLEADLRTLAAFEEDSLITQSGDQKDPDIDYMSVAWQDERNSRSDIYTYDLDEDIEAQLTNNSEFQDLPRIDGERIVWMDYRTGNGDIYLYDPIYDTIIISPHPDLQTAPDIDGNIIVWAQLKSGDPGNWDIYMFDLGTWQISAICTAEGRQTHPSISENIVVWEDWRNGNADIYARLLKTGEEKEICTDPADQLNPVICKQNKWRPGSMAPPDFGGLYNGIRIFYQDDRNGHWDIYMWADFMLGDLSLGTEHRITDKNTYNPSDQVNPDFAHNQCVYQENKDGDWDIYAYQTETGYTGELVPICTATADQVNPRTSGGRIVWDDYRHGDADIYIWDRPPGSDMTLGINESRDPIGVGKLLEYQLVVRNDGPDMNENIEITCSLPLKAKYEEHSVTKGTTKWEGINLQWNIAELRFDSLAVLTIRFRTYDYATLTFQAEVQGNAIDPDPSNNTIIETTDVRYVIPDAVGPGVNPDMTAENDGHFHVVYFNQDSLMYAHKENLGAWEAEKLAVFKEYTGQSCALALDNQQKMHICYSTYDRDESPPARLYHMWQDDQGHWQKEIIAVSETGYAGIQLEIDSQDEIHLVFRATEEYIFYAPMKFMKTVDGEWTQAYMIEEEGYSDIDMVLDDMDKPHLSYYAVNKGIIYHYCQDPDANLWSPAEIIEPNWGGGQMEGMETSISLDAAGIPHISYVGNVDQDYHENIKHAWKKAGIWIIEKVDDGDFGSSGNEVYAEDPQEVHFIYNHFLSGEIRYATNVAGPWIRQAIDDDIENVWFQSTLIDQDINHNNHLIYEKDDYIYYATRPPVPILEIHPDTLDFSTVPVDSTKRITVFLKNPEKRNMIVDSAVIAEYNCFEVEKAFKLLPPGESDGMDVYFSPTSEGLYNTSLRIYYNAPSGMFVEIPVVTRTQMPMLKVEPDPINFGAVPENTQMTLTVDLINEGDKDLTFSEINVKKEIFGQVFPTDFDLISSTCSTLSGGDTCKVNIGFEPLSAASQNSFLNIYSNDPMEPEKQIKIKGRTPTTLISFSNNSIDFGYVPLNGSATKEILIFNT
ncbi:MAG: choice-of-anchor D domain-containing protein [Bacteroidota bacterium]|nr:choice-of-anchor D domain-containing protein [Bacteroidota bacterium]